MRAQDIHNFFFHPLAIEHSDTRKVLSVVAVVALSFLTAGLFAIAFVIVNWNDRKITIEKIDPKVFTAASPVLTKVPKTQPNKTMHQEKAERIKQKQAEQLTIFEKWAKAKDWQSIHGAHYDWWMFPVDRPSAGHGDTYAVSRDDIESLKADATFMKNYKRGVAIVVEAWGWDLDKDKPISNPEKGQKWTGYGVRLAKMSDSLHLFGEADLHQKLRLFFTQFCLPQQDHIPISDLPWLYKTFAHHD